MVYPENISEYIAGLRHFSTAPDPGAAGKEVNFACGSFVLYSLVIDDGAIATATFSSNGCGYMMAAADILADLVTGEKLRELHGLAPKSLRESVSRRTGEVPASRRECIEACIKGLREAFSHFRDTKIEEFRGEKALLCTCFGITEETVETLLQDSAVRAVEDVTRRCRAGGGCGSCTMMIQEMLDNRLG